MAKKSRRSRAKTKTPGGKPVTLQTSNAYVGNAARSTSESQSVNSSALATMELQRKYVMTELRRIGIIAGSLIVIIIILTFVLG